MMRFAAYSKTVFPPGIPARRASQSTGWVFWFVVITLETHPESLPGNCALQFRLAERQN
jgi:hypothetical protein